MPSPRLAALLTAAVLAVSASPVGAAGPVAAPAPEAPTAPSSPAAGSPTVTGFALGSLRTARLDRSAASLDVVTVAGIGLRASGAAVGRPTPQMERVRRAAAARGLRTELLVSNYSNRLEDFDPRAAHRLLSEPTRTRRVAERVATLARDGGWDGVNVDLELVRAGDAAGLTRFVEQLQAALPDPATVSIDVSAATSPAGYRQRGYQLAGLGRAADVVVLMAYDQHGPTWSGPGPIGDLRWQRRAVGAALTLVPATRLDLGVAGYGYTWPRRGTGRSVSPAVARRLAARDGVRPRWHAASGEWSARLDDGTRLWWSDARSYDGRVQLARDLGLHGLAVWQLGTADPLG